MKRVLLVAIAGVLFGAGLALSGMTDPKRVVDFLDVTGSWDPTLAFVMGGALVVYASGYAILRGRLPLPNKPEGPISPALVIGSILFGVGWGLGGFCPGPGIANLGALRLEAVVFVSTMAIGMIVAQRTLHLDR